MNLLQERQKKYQSLTVPVRIGSLAANLARIATVAPVPAINAVANMLNESRAFIEWVAPELTIDQAARLADIQRALTRWYYKWQHIHQIKAEREELAKQAQSWSDEILVMSGLLDSKEN